MIQPCARCGRPRDDVRAASLREGVCVNCVLRGTERADQETPWWRQTLEDVLAAIDVGYAPYPQDVEALCRALGVILARQLVVGRRVVAGRVAA